MCRWSSLEVTTFNIISSGSSPPLATIGSAAFPTSVLSRQTSSDKSDQTAIYFLPTPAGGPLPEDLSTYFSAICCLKRSPVESERMSYFVVKRPERVPFPAPGWNGAPEMNMQFCRKNDRRYFGRHTLPNIIILKPDLDEPAVGASSLWIAPDRELLRKNGMALFGVEELPNARAEWGARCATAVGRSARAIRCTQQVDGQERRGVGSRRPSSADVYKGLVVAERNGRAT